MKVCEVVDMVQDLNTKYYWTAAKNNSLVEALVEENPPLILETTGKCMVVNFYNIQVWSSEDDERPYINEDEEEQMPLKIWLEEEVMRILAVMSDFHAMLLME